MGEDEARQTTVLSGGEDSKEEDLIRDRRLALFSDENSEQIRAEVQEVLGKTFVCTGDGDYHLSDRWFIRHCLSYYLPQPIKGEHVTPEKQQLLDRRSFVKNVFLYLPAYGLMGHREVPSC